jgi:hypothetical protein
VPPPAVTLIPRSHDKPERRYQAEHRFVLNKRLIDSSGKPVTGLKDEDLTLLDAGQARKSAAFQVAKGATATARAHALLLLDTVNNSSRLIACERKEIQKFLA